MKKPLIAAAICLGMASLASAQTIRINQPDGELLLEQDRCRTSGQQATFIESRSNGGGAYGCWEFKDGYVYVRWTQMIGPTGSILNTDKVVRYQAPEGLSAPEGKDKGVNDRRAPVRSTPLAPPIAPEKKSAYHVDMADADVTLDDEPCKGGGKRASFKHKLYDIGGYGCWIDGGQQILVHWTRKKTLSGTIEPFDLHSKIQRPADMPAVTANHALEQPTRKVKELIGRVDKTAMSCRELQNQVACDKMAEAVSDVMKAGWCWGPEDVASSEKRWGRCK